MISEFDEFAIHGKLMKEEIQWNKKSGKLELKSKRYPFFKISKISD